MSAPYNIALKIEYPSGTARDDVEVTVRLESTNESKTLETNSSGEVIFGLGNTTDFPSGWRIGDVFSYVVFYTGYEASGSHTIVSTEGGYRETVVLTDTPTAPSLRYFAPQEFLDYFNLQTYKDDAENGIKMQQLVKIGETIENDIDTDCDTKFDDNDGSYYSKTEHLDTDEYQKEYWLTKRPISSITNLYTTANDSDTTPDYPNNTTGWTSLTEGTDFSVDKDSGRVQITNGSYYPITRRWGLYAVYVYGRSSVPSDIKQLAIIETAVRMGLTSSVRAKIGDENPDASNFMDFFNSYRQRVIRKYQYFGIRNT